METQKDDFRIKVELQEKELLELQQKNEDLSSLAEEARTLKDEMDVLRHTSDKVSKYEQTIETLKKRLDEMSDLKGQIRLLKEKNTSYMQTNMELEEEVRKSGTYKSQQENGLSQKPLKENELCKSVSPAMCDTQPYVDMGCSLDSVSLTDVETSNQLEHGLPTSSSTPIKDADELVHNMDSGIHASDREADSFNELMSMHDPMLSSSPLVILNPETVLQGLHEDINSLLQTRNRNSLGSHGIPNIQCTLEEVSINQCLATSLVWGRILFNMELLRSQRCKNPLKGSGLV